MSEVDPAVRKASQERLRVAVRDHGLSAEDMREYTAAKSDRRGEKQLAFLLRWAEGHVPTARVELHEGLALQTERSQVERRMWCTKPELLNALGGLHCKEQKKYCESVWKTAGKWGERSHPEEGLPAQRRCYVGSIDELRRLRQRRTELGLAAEVDQEATGSAGVQQMVASLEAPGPMLAWGPSVQSDATATAGAGDPASHGQPVSSTPGRPESSGSSGDPPARPALNRTELMGELGAQLLKCLRLADQLDEVPGRMSEAGKQDLEEHVKSLRDVRGRLETAAPPVDQQLLETCKNHLRDGLSTLTRCQQLLPRGLHAGTRRPQEA